MSLRHIGNREDWYVITTPQGGRDEASWKSQKVSLHGPNVMASASWSVLGKHSFGVGFQVGRNGGQSDLGLDLYAGRLGSVWLRLATPWTKWANISRDSGDKYCYEARHYGVRLLPFDGCLLGVQWGAHDGHSGRDVSGVDWHSTSLRRAVLGLNHTETETVGSGETVVPLPEGLYAATWSEKVYVTTHTRPVGKLFDKLRGPRVTRSLQLDIPGGIPVEGKGENSWDCGMDGLFGITGRTVEDAVGHAVSSVLRDRQRYGGPHNLSRATSVAEASS